MASSTSHSTKPSVNQTLTFGLLTFPACNHYGRIGTDETHPEFIEICWFLQRCPLQYAITAKPKMSKFLLGNFWLTYSYDASSDQIHASVLSDDEPDVVFDTEDVRTILRLPSYETYETFPLGNEHQQVVSVLNHTPLPDVTHKTPSLENFPLEEKPQPLNTILYISRCIFHLKQILLFLFKMPQPC